MNMYVHDMYTAVDCGSLPNPVNGAVSLSSGTTFRSIATYVCNIGFMLTVSTPRTCGSDGRWSPAAPGCLGKMIPTNLIKITTIIQSLAN